MNYQCLYPRQPLSRVLTLALLSGLSLYPLLALGLSHRIRSASFAVLFGVHLIILACGVFASLKALLDCTRSLKVGAAYILLGAFFLALLMIEGLHPITARDALIHHMAVPRWWVAQGTIAPMYWHEWSFYPMLLELGFSGLILFHLESFAAFYHLAYLILVSALVTLFLQERGKGKEIAIVGGLSTMILPILARLGTVPNVDLGLTLFAFCALILVVHGTERQRFLYFAFAGVALGLTLATKYNGLVSAISIGAAFVLFAERSKVSRRALVGYGAAILIFALVIFLPWALKNYAWTGNPLFPLFKHHTADPVQTGVPAGLSPLEQRRWLYHESWLDIALTPIRMLLVTDDADIQRFDGVLSPLLLLAVLPLVIRKERRNWMVFFAIYCAVYFLIANCFAASRTRYLAPLFAPLMVLTAIGAGQVSEAIIRLPKAVTLRFIFALQVVWSGFYFARMLHASDALAYSMGKESARQYLARALPEYSLIEQFNEIAPRNARIYLVLTANEFYYVDRQVFSGGHFSAAPLLEWIKSSDDAAALARHFEKEQITYLLLHRGRLQGLLNDTLSDREKLIWNEFQKRYLHTIGSDRGFLLLEVKPMEEETQ